MKTSFLLSSFFALALTAGAQSATDPVLMTINGKPVTKAEFEYSFHKNGNVEGAVEKKTVEEYVPMFINSLEWLLKNQLRRLYQGHGS